MTEEPTPTRDHIIQLRLTQAGADAVDEMRGSWNRSQYLRHLLKVARVQKIYGPKAPDDFD